MAVMLIFLSAVLQTVPVMAASGETAASQIADVPDNADQSNFSRDIQVAITSPFSIESVPVHDDTVEITVKNISQQAYTNLSCYLTVVDVGRKQTYPVDEFGENAYQTRAITELLPGSTEVIKIPVHILYVGDFRFTASVADSETKQIVTGNALIVKMTAVSNLDRGIVMKTAVCVPVAVAGLAFILTRRRKRTVLL